MRVISRVPAIIGLAFSLAILGFGPGVALGGQSFYEDNYSYDFDGFTSVGVCDLETDGDPAYAEYVVQGQVLRLDDANGSQPGCSTQGNAVEMDQHRVCEGVPFNDPCGPVVENPN